MKRVERSGGAAWILLPALLALMTASDAAQPPTLGMKSERFRPCPDRPNCVSSEAEGPSARVEPLRFTGTPVAAWERLKAAVGAVGGRVEEEGEHYLRATFTSRVFRFVDDLECRLVPDAGIIHVRSASRVGFWDLGVNRRRVEALRQAFHSEPSGRP